MSAVKGGGGQRRRFLLAIDFDNTLITHPANTALCVQPLFAGASGGEPGKIPDDVWQVKKTLGWDAFIRATFAALFKAGVTRDEIVRCLHTQQLLPGMKELLLWTKEVGGDIIVVTDSFDVNVREVLDFNGVGEGVVDAVFARESRFTEEGELVIEDSESSGNNNERKRRCSISNRLVCKGQALLSYLEEKRSGSDFDFACFAGDGTNDLCACLKLDPGRGDLAMARKGFPLAGLLEEERGKRLRVDVVRWEDGWQIKEAIQKRIASGR